MPELPEVETIARGLDRKLPGLKIVKAKVLRKDSIESPSPAQFCRQIEGHRFGNVYRRGKYLLANLSDNAAFVCHLRMSGRLLFIDQDVPLNKFVRVRIFLENGKELRFEDMRVFGRLWYVPRGRAVEEIVTTIGELGVEPLAGLTGKQLALAFKGKKQPVKSALLDQRLIAGIGNIYADESLFLSRIHPLTQAGALKGDELEILSARIQEVLSRAIKSGGSTLRDYVDSDGVNGNYQDRAMVYGRKGEPCRVCGSEIEVTKIGGRSSHYCSQCQIKKRARRR